MEGTTPAAGGAWGDGRWNLEGNGWPGTLQLQQDPDSPLNGFSCGDRAVSYHAPGERTAVLLRGPGGQPTQAFIGLVSAYGVTWSGVPHALSAAAGANPVANRCAFGARRAPHVPSPVAVTPGRLWLGSGGAPCPGDTLFGRGPAHHQRAHPAPLCRFTLPAPRADIHGSAPYENRVRARPRMPRHPLAPPGSGD